MSDLSEKLASLLFGNNLNLPENFDNIVARFSWERMVDNVLN